MSEPIEDTVYLWMVHHAPVWLHDEQLFEALVRFIKGLLARVERED